MLTKQHIPFLLASLVAFFLVHLSTRLYGAGLSPDSIHYISLARNLASGAGLVTYNGEPSVAQPPLYPFLLASIEIFFRVDPLVSAAFVNALLFGAIVYLAGLLFSKTLSSFAFVLLGLALVVLAPALLRVSVMAWSEPLFICLTLVFLLYQQKFLEARAARSFVVFTFAAALACLTRYLGVTLILTGALALVLLLQERWQVKARYLFLFCFFSALPLALWATRNYLVSTTFFGRRAPSASPLSRNISLTLRTVSSWYFAGKTLIERILFLSAIAGICGVAFFAMARNVPRVRDSFGRAGGVVLFCLLYGMFLIVSATTTAFDSINDRLLSPIFIPLLLCVLLILENFYRTLEARTSKKFIAAIPLALVAVSLLLNSLNVAQRDVNMRIQQGAGEYNRKTWRESALIQYLAQHPLNGRRVVYSNAPDVMYILLNQPARSSPAKTYYNSTAPAADVSRLTGDWLEEEGAYLVWFGSVKRTYLFSVDELRNFADVREQVRFPDGVIFELSARAPLR